MLRGQEHALSESTTPLRVHPNVALTFRRCPCQNGQRRTLPREPQDSLKAVNPRDAEIRMHTVVAEMITELIRFEPEICICNGN